MRRIVSCSVVTILLGTPAVSLACLAFCGSTSHGRAGDPCAAHHSQQEPAPVSMTAAAACDPALATLPYLREDQRDNVSLEAITNVASATIPIAREAEMAGRQIFITPPDLIHQPGSTPTYILVSSLLI